jgi:hypothetical protein
MVRVVVFSALALSACRFDTGGLGFTDDGGARDAGADAPFYSLNVIRAGSAAGRVTSSPAGIDCGPTCSASFAGNSVVVLSAQATSGAQVVGWAGACAGQGNPCTLTVIGPLTTSVQFEPAGQTLWGRLVGGKEDDAAFDVAVAPGGDVVIAAGVKGSVDLGLGVTMARGGRDWLVARYLPNGAVRWAVRAGGGADDIPAGVAVDESGDVYATGQFQAYADFVPGSIGAAGPYDGIVVKYDGATGQAKWATPISGSATELGRAVATVPGMVLVAGIYTSATLGVGTTTLVNVGDYDAFVVALDADDGAPVWARSFGGDNAEQVTDIAARGDAVVLAGAFSGNTNLGGGPRATNGKKDLFFVALDRQLGTYLWDRTFGSSGNDLAEALAVGSQGQVAVVGEYEAALSVGGGLLPHASGADAFVVLCSSDGKHIWSRGLAGGGDDLARGVDVAPDGSVLVTGGLSQALDFGNGPVPTSGKADAFVARYGANGVLIWTRNFHGTQVDYSTRLAADPLSFVAVVGDTIGPLDLGFGPQISAGGLDLFVARLRL